MHCKTKNYNNKSKHHVSIQATSLWVKFHFPSAAYFFFFFYVDYKDICVFISLVIFMLFKCTMQTSLIFLCVKRKLKQQNKFGNMRPLSMAPFFCLTRYVWILLQDKKKNLNWFLFCNTYNFSFFLLVVMLYASMNVLFRFNKLMESELIVKRNCPSHTV